MSLYRGGCSCGGLRYHISNEPIFTQACHCRLCQRQTASAFIIRTMIESSYFHVDSGELICLLYLYWLLDQWGILQQKNLKNI